MKIFRSSNRTCLTALVSVGLSVAIAGCKSPAKTEDGVRTPASGDVLPGLNAPLISLPMDKIACVDGPLRSKNGNHSRKDCTYETPPRKANDPRPHARGKRLRRKRLLARTTPR